MRGSNLLSIEFFRMAQRKFLRGLNTKSLQKGWMTLQQWLCPVRMNLVVEFIYSILKLMVPNIEKHAGKMISFCVVLVGNRYKFAIVIR